MNNEAALSRLCFHGERLQAETGVSQATVSNVLNNDPRQTIPEETRVKILEATHNSTPCLHAKSAKRCAEYQDVQCAMVRELAYRGAEGAP